MATYTDINGVKLISTGDEAGTWGTSTNTNLQIIERASNGFVQIALTGTSYTLTLSNQPSSAENGHFKAIEFTGTPGGTCTVTLEQNDHARVYMILNSTNQSVILTQGSGGNVTILAADGAIVLADGAGSGAQVKYLTATFQTETADQLSTARNFSITGDITASAVSFDGTGNVALSAAYTAGSIVNADINSSAAIADTKLDTISTSSKVSNSATTATDSNTNSAIVARDGSGNFSAGTITANLTGNASGSSGSCTGNAATATKLASAVNIAGVSFDGSQSISLNNNAITNGANYITASSNITGNAAGISKSGDVDITSSGGDIILTAAGDDVFMRGTTSDEQLKFALGSTSQEITSSDNLSISTDYDSSATTRYLEIKNVNPNNDGPIRLVVANDRNIEFRTSTGTVTHGFHVDSTNGAELTLSGTQGKINTSGTLVLNPNNGFVSFRDDGTTRALFDLNTANTLKIAAGSADEEVRITDSGMNVINGLRVGDTTAPTDNDLHVVGDITCGGALSKGSGSFQIPHPLSSKTNTHYLVHSFLEGPQADLIYRGKVTLTGGFATVNIDRAAGMSEGTFACLCRDVQCFTSNETGWTSVKGSVSGNTLTIYAQDDSCTDTISWMVVGERKDQHMVDTDWTDETGKVIVEPIKVIEQ